MINVYKTAFIDYSRISVLTWIFEKKSNFWL